MYTEGTEAGGEEREVKVEGEVLMASDGTEETAELTGNRLVGGTSGGGRSVSREVSGWEGGGGGRREEGKRGRKFLKNKKNKIKDKTSEEERWKKVKREEVIYSHTKGMVVNAIM